MIILGIETSCDDTGIALVKCSASHCQILSNIISSQIKIHAPYGGVVPNLAARAHLDNIQPCLEKALQEANSPEIDLIAVTEKPGLIPSLLIGLNFAKALAYAWQKPIVKINHLHGHIYANWLVNQKIEFPVLCLVVSGGHTQLILMKKHNQFKLLGETRDDAAGEAFDKVAKLLNLGYPGGPIISQKAKQGNPKQYAFPRPMLKTDNYDFSFSGLKTAVLYETKKQPPRVNDMAASFQQAVIDVLVKKTFRAAEEYKVKTVMLAGGVAANSELRKHFQHVPSPELCTDNGAMIATAAYYRYNN